MQSHARLVTDKAARYMTQLAKHWGHKFEVELTETTAFFPLTLGPCRMTADAEGLDMTVEAADAEALAKLEQVVADHILRFAFRENIEKLNWTRAREAGHIDPPKARGGLGLGV